MSFKVLIAANFYPRSPCGERQSKVWINPCSVSFLSTLSLRRATVENPLYGNQWRFISIHALLAESDGQCSAPLFIPPYFYPRSPCGERQKACQFSALKDGFLSTLSLRRATAPKPHLRVPFLISIHALLAESDSLQAIVYAHSRYFYPRSPCGERLSSACCVAVSSKISIHALLAESDWHGGFHRLAAVDISIHALLAESDAV